MHEFTENKSSKTAYDYKTEIVLPLSGKKYTQINYVEIFLESILRKSLNANEKKK